MVLLSVLGWYTLRSSREVASIPSYPVQRPQTPRIPAPDEIVGEDLPCRRCGYNLRGLAFGGRCPECNTPVEMSAQSDALRYADPVWLGRLAIGAAILMAERILTLIWTPMWLVLYRSVRAFMPIDLFTIVLHALSLAGWWLLATPDPSGLGEDKYGRSRSFARVASLVAAGVACLGQVRRASALPPFADVATTVGIYLLGIIPVIGEAARYRYLAALSGRIPRDALVRSAKSFSSVMPILAGLYLLNSFVFWLGLQLRGRVATPVRVLGCSYLVLMLVMMIATLGTFNLVRKLHQALRQQIVVAAQFWATRDAPDSPIS